MNIIAKNISIVYRQFNTFIGRELAESDLKATELMYLSSLYERDGVTQDELVREFFIDKAATARAIQTLEKKGIIERKTDTNDKRAKRIYLLPKADDYIDIIDLIQKKWINQCNFEISKEELTAFATVLKKMAENVKEFD